MWDTLDMVHVYGGKNGQNRCYTGCYITLLSDKSVQDMFGKVYIFGKLKDSIFRKYILL